MGLPRAYIITIVMLTASLMSQLVSSIIVSAQVGKVECFGSLFYPRTCLYREGVKRPILRVAVLREFYFVLY